jgi:hypothetical protein
MMPAKTAALRLPAHLVLLALLATLLPLLTAPSASAAPPQPDTPSVGRDIEDYAGYEANTICDPVNTPGAVKLAKLIRRTYGSDESIGIARNACYTTSEHNDGRALDWMVDATTRAGKRKANTFLDWLLATDDDGNRHAMARRLGVMYIIHDRRIWRAYGDPGWGPYSGTNPHTDHIHISLSYDGSTGRSSFWTGDALAGPCSTGSLLSAAPRVETQPMRYVPVAPTRLASTETGKGMLSGPCRLADGQHIDVQVVGRGPVPSEGVAAVALQVSMRRPNWESGLTAGPAGGDIPGVRRLTTAQNAISSGLMVLPVGADGKVSFATDFGATDLAVSVVGFYVDPDAPRSVRRQVAADGGDELDAVAPQRLADNLTLGPSDAAKVEVAGRAGTDSASSSANVTVTVDAGAGRGDLYVYPAGGERPRVPVLSYDRHATTVLTSVPLGRRGKIVLENTGKGRRTVDLDISGAYEPAALAGGRSLALRKNPRTVVDTAKNLQVASFGAGTTKDFSVGDAVPRDAAAVLLQVTVRHARQGGTLTFWEPGTERPNTVDLSVVPGGTVTGTVLTSLANGRKVRVNNTGIERSDVRITVLGSFQ